MSYCWVGLIFLLRFEIRFDRVKSFWKNESINSLSNNNRFLLSSIYFFGAIKRSTILLLLPRQIINCDCQLLSFNHFIYYSPFCRRGMDSWRGKFELYLATRILFSTFQFESFLFFFQSRSHAQRKFQRNFSTCTFVIPIFIEAKSPQDKFVRCCHLHCRVSLLLSSFLALPIFVKRRHFEAIFRN